jgi:excisionase family DNA binding protein
MAMTNALEEGTEAKHRCLINIGDTAHMLGISVRAIYRLIASGEIPPPVKIGRATRMVLAEVEAYIERLKARRGGVDLS